MWTPELYLPESDEYRLEAYHDDDYIYTEDFSTIRSGTPDELPVIASSSVGSSASPSKATSSSSITRVQETEVEQSRTLPPSSVTPTAGPEGLQQVEADQAQPENTSRNDLSTGAAIGIGIGIAALVVIIVAVAFLLYRRRRAKSPADRAASPIREIALETYPPKTMHSEPRKRHEKDNVSFLPELETKGNIHEIGSVKKNTSHELSGN